MTLTNDLASNPLSTAQKHNCSDVVQLASVIDRKMS